MSDGGKKLFLLGVISVAIAIVTTGVSVFLYHISGDIYLDRSRPGFLPDEEENKEDELKGDYKFQNTGTLNAKALDEYLQNYDKVVEDIHATTDPFSAKSLSNESLGIPNN